MTKERASEIQKKFVAKYGRGKVGTIIGDDETPVELGPVTMSCFCSDDKVSEFGCNPKVIALLVEWMPSGMEYEEAPVCGCNCHRGRLMHVAPCCYRGTREIGVNLAKIPPKKTWMNFPRQFMGVPVHYKRRRPISPYRQFLLDQSP